MTNESTPNRPACPFCGLVPDEFAKVAGYMRMYAANCCDCNHFVMLNEDLEYSWAAHCALYALCEASKLKPVMIPVLPRFNSHCSPTCFGCFLSTEEEPDDGRGYCALGCNEHPYSPIPGPTCPIHNPQAREVMEPL